MFIVFKQLGWVNTLLLCDPVVLCGGAYNIFLLRQFFMTLPTEPSDAARIDGASEFGILFRIAAAGQAGPDGWRSSLHGAWNDYLGRWSIYRQQQ